MSFYLSVQTTTFKQQGNFFLALPLKLCTDIGGFNLQNVKTQNDYKPIIYFR